VQLHGGGGAQHWAAAKVGANNSTPAKAISRPSRGKSIFVAQHI
jgi:hypothetical protein